MKIRIKSVKSKIIVFFIGLAAFQICVMAGFAKLQLEPSIVSMYSEHLERFADVALTETTQETEKIERYMVNIIGDAQIQDFLRRADEEQSAELPPVLSTELRNRILSYTDYDNIITAIYLVDNYGRIYSNLGKSPMQTFMNRNQELKDRKEESAVWYGGENGNTITVYRNVNNNTTDLTQKIGALCIFIDRKMFQERIDDLMMEEEQHYVLENEERHLKISSDQDETEERDSIVVMRTDGRWGLRTWIEKDIIYRPVKMMMRILLAELFALLLVSIALVVFLSERITRPIRKLTIAMKEIGAGNIDTVVLDEGEDELGLLAATLNRMSKSIKKLMEQIHEDEKQKRYLELKAMQYQINPHFFMNTLNNIHALVDIDTGKAKSSIVELSKLMRYVLYEASNKTILLSREVQFLKNYIALMSLRYTNKVSIKMDFPAEVPEVQIPPLLFVSFVENAFKHGVSYRSESFIHVLMQLDEGNRLSFRCSNSNNGSADEQHHGIGLENIRKRLRLLFGNDYTLSITEEEHKFDVLLIIPLLE